MTSARTCAPSGHPIFECDVTQLRVGGECVRGEGGIVWDCCLLGKSLWAKWKWRHILCGVIHLLKWLFDSPILPSKIIVRYILPLARVSTLCMTFKYYIKLPVFTPWKAHTFFIVLFPASFLSLFFCPLFLHLADASHRISDASPRSKSAWAGGQGHPDWERRRAMKEEEYNRQMQKAYKPDLPLKLFLEEEARRQISAFKSHFFTPLYPYFPSHIIFCFFLLKFSTKITHSYKRKYLYVEIHFENWMICSQHSSSLQNLWVLSLQLISS